MQSDDLLAIRWLGVRVNVGSSLFYSANFIYFERIFTNYYKIRSSFIIKQRKIFKIYKSLCKNLCSARIKTALIRMLNKNAWINQFSIPCSVGIMLRNMAENLPKLTVSELTSMIKNMLSESFYELTVEGEISSFKVGTSGHWYFALKDNDALINAVVWRSTVHQIGFVPSNGQKVVVKGNIDVYAPSGSYKIICSSIKVSGEGDILAELERRKREYDAKGYFDQSHKKPIPQRPDRVAIITSPTGAALQDILQVTGRRNASMDIIILPAAVQGEDAAKTIAARIEQVNTFGLADVMIVGRGGGSIEDLLPFSEDCVIQAIYKSDIPVISAVGHEIDWAISDFVSDLRAPTPSAAAELVCESAKSQQQTVDNIRNNMMNAMDDKISNAKLKLSNVRPEAFIYSIENEINTIRRRCDSSISQLKANLYEVLSKTRTRYEIAQTNINASSPVSILDRGYSIVTDENGKTVRNSDNIKQGKILGIRFARGKAIAQVTEVKNG